MELRDGDKSRYGGKGVLTAIDNVNDKISPEIVDMDVTDQRSIDLRMIDIDGTDNKNNLGANAIVGGSAGIATGAAFSSKQLKLNRVAVCFFGDGALGQGLLYECMNMAQLWKLPVIYVCENNLYNEYTHQSETTAGSLTGRGWGDRHDDAKIAAILSNTRSRAAQERGAAA